MDVHAYREHIYSHEADDEVSWFESDPALSVRLIREIGIEPATRMIDVGGGSSRLVDRLLDLGAEQATVLDVSTTALARVSDGSARERRR